MRKLKLLPISFLFLFLTSTFASESPYFPYSLSLKTDLPLGGLALLLNVPANYLQNQMKAPGPSNINALQNSSLNFLDAAAINNFSPSQSNLSDIGLTISRYAPFILAVPMLRHGEWSSLVTFAAIYSEALSINGTLTQIAKASVKRARPFEYGTQLNMDQKLGSGTNGISSFYSGHTSVVFCSAVLLSTEFSEMYPTSKLKPFVWGASLGVATATGILRYTSGNHFPTDILVGAAVGSLIGYAIPALHRDKRESSLSIRPMVGETDGVQALVKF